MPDTRQNVNKHFSVPSLIEVAFEWGWGGGEEMTGK